MAYDNLPELTEYPEGDGLIPGEGVSLPLVLDGFGVIAAQSGDDLHEVLVQIAVTPSPRGGVISVAINADGARALADHLCHLAKYAELGVAAEAPGE